MTNIILADDHAVVREGLKALILAEPDFHVVAEVADGATALERCCALLPDVLVSDLSMPGLNGVQLIEKIRRACSSVRVLVLTVHEDRGYLRQSLHAGASGYLLKRAAATELIAALRAVAAGETWLDPTVSMGDDHFSLQLATPPHPALSDREGEVLRLIARGFSSSEVGKQLGVGVKSIETYKSRALDKLGLRSRVEIIRYGVSQGWLQEL